METLISIDCYQGAYGPTIRMGIQAAEGLVALRHLLRGLAAGSTHACDVRELPFVQLIGMHGLVLRSVHENRRKTVELERRKDGTSVFHWSNSLEGWNHCAGLVDGITGTIPSHQYLSQEGIDDALIVVAYREETPTQISPISPTP